MKTIKTSRRKTIRRTLWFIALISYIFIILNVATNIFDFLPSSVIIVEAILGHLCLLASVFVYPLFSNYYFHNYGNEEINQEYKDKKIKECKRNYFKKKVLSFEFIYLILSALGALFIGVNTTEVSSVTEISPYVYPLLGVVFPTFLCCISIIISELLNKDKAEEENDSNINLTCKIKNELIPFTLDRNAEKSTISKDALIELIDKGLISEVTFNDVAIYDLNIGEVKCDITKADNGLTLNYKTITYDECKGIYPDKDTSSVIIY